MQKLQEQAPTEIASRLRIAVLIPCFKEELCCQGFLGPRCPDLCLRQQLHDGTAEVAAAAGAVRRETH